jgi:hypothetical protein
MRTIKQLIAIVPVALMLTGIGVAQTSPSAGNGPQANVPAEPQATPAQEGPAHTAPVFWVSSVEVFHSAHSPQLDIVRVRGLASTGGWESGELIPLTKGIPADGILDLAFVAVAPEDNTNPTAYPVIEAVFAIEPGHPFKGVRVHGAANRVSLANFPGYAEAGGQPRDCASCVGKYLLRKGGAVPTNHPEDSIVHEEELPKNLRILRDSDGIGSLDSDPNRMTLVLNEKGEIVVALWD